MEQKNKKIAFLCSGDGGNLRFIQNCIHKKLLTNTKIAVVISGSMCGAIEYARRQKISFHICDFKVNNQREVADLLKSYDPDLIITTVNKILTPQVLKILPGRYINLHYSLLPAFTGTIGINSVKQAIGYGVKCAGVTVHYAEEIVDAGKPLFQAVVPIYQKDTPEIVMNIIFRCGALALVSTIKNLLNGTATIQEKIVQMENRHCLFNPAPILLPEIQEENFWTGMK